MRISSFCAYVDGGVTPSVVDGGTVYDYACGLVLGSKALYSCSSTRKGGVGASVNSSNSSIPQAAGAFDMGFDIRT